MADIRPESPADFSGMRIQRKVTNGYRAMWAAEGEADIRSVVDTARLKPGTSVFNTILQTVTA